MHPQNISIKDYDYFLPEEKIAFFPLEKRDQSKLLIFTSGSINEDVYLNLAKYLPEKTFLVFNDTKVINARILFTKPTGALIEIFCLEPWEPVIDYSIILQQQKSVRWKCMIGGAGKWKEKFLEKRIVINKVEINLRAQLVKKLPDAYGVELSWEPCDYSFAEILEHAGKTPLPPYIKRDAADGDTRRYQTIYSKYEGSVAAPTAGLHFTDEIFSSLSAKKITKGFVTLHVGAGTFKPVKSETMEGHDMHAEWMDVSVEFIQQLIENIPNGVFCVGTTSVRTIESLYWMGLKANKNSNASMHDLEIKQWEVYKEDFFATELSAPDALRSLLKYLHDNKLTRLFATTQIIITPGYQFRIIKGMVTNFHQPKSTLLLLVAALAGKKWKDIYEYALANNFRFLSYGDGCLIFRSSP